MAVLQRQRRAHAMVFVRGWLASKPIATMIQAPHTCDLRRVTLTFISASMS